MKKIMGLLLALIMVMTLATAAFATTGGELFDGDNEIELPWDATEASTYTYKATQTGTLYVVGTYFGWANKNDDYSDNTDYMNEWGMYTSLTVNGVELEGKYYGSVEVVKGRTYTFSWAHRDPNGFGWCATLNLSYTDDLGPKPGSEELPVELHIEDCPTTSIKIDAYDVAYYRLYDFDGAHLTVTGDGAYVYMTYINMDTMLKEEHWYEAVNGVAVAPIHTSYCTILIGNDGDYPATFGLDYYYAVGSVRNPAQLVMGENVAVTQKDNYNGYYFTWTAQSDGALTLSFPETGWMYEIVNNTSGQNYESSCISTTKVNPVDVEVSKGDVLTINVNTFDAQTFTVPGGELRFTASIDCDHAYQVTGSVAGSCTVQASTTYTCSLCGFAYTETGDFDANTHSNLTLTGAVDATCTVDGYTGDQICNDCGATAIAGEVIPALGHSYEVTDSVEGTCVIKSTTTYTCTVCGDAYTEEGEVDSSKHGNLTLTGVKDATCAENGYTGEYVCDDCGATVTAGESIPALGHSYEVTATVEATCVIKAATTYTCATCGDSYTQEGELASGKHGRLTLTGATDATCTTDGYTGDQTCNDCGAVIIAGKAIPALGHSYEVTATTDGTCVTKATTTYTCAICGDSYTEEGAVAADKHGSFTLTGYADSTCTADGYTGDQVCDDCGTTVIWGESIPALGHSYELTATTEGTCVTKATTTYTCAICGDSYTEAGALDSSKHGNLTLNNVKEATCTMDGYTGDQVCDDCGAIVEAGQRVSALGHSFGDWETVSGTQQKRTCATCGLVETRDTACQHWNVALTGATDATCTTDGYTGDQVCGDCGQIITAGSVLPALGHSYEVTATTDGTCIIKATTSYCCAICGHTYTETGALDSSKHGNLTLTGEKSATCTTTGHTGNRVCDDCGAIVIAGESIPALGHSYEVTATVEATCTVKASTTYTCAACGHSYTELGEIAADHHGEATLTGEKSATCTAPGYTGDQVCGDCGLVLVQGEEIAALGHSFGQWVEGDGVQTRTCATCGLEETQILDCLHENTALINAKDATCTEAGYTGDRLCTGCSQIIQQGEALAALGHSFGQWTAVAGAQIRTCATCGLEETCRHENATLTNAKDATCTETGYTGDLVCDECGATVTAGETIPALSHSFGAWETVQAPTATEDGSKKRTCAACGAEETEVIPATGEIETQPTEPETKPSEPVAEPTTQPTTVPTTQPGGNESGNGGVIIAVIIVALLAGGVAAFVIIKKKK